MRRRLLQKEVHTSTVLYLYIANILFLLGGPRSHSTFVQANVETHVHSRIALAVHGKRHSVQLSTFSLFAWNHAPERSGRAIIAAL